MSRVRRKLDLAPAHLYMSIIYSAALAFHAKVAPCAGVLTLVFGFFMWYKTSYVIIKKKLNGKAKKRVLANTEALVSLVCFSTDIATTLVFVVKMFFFSFQQSYFVEK